MSHFSTLLLPFWDAIGWTMLHFLWIGVLFALAARLVLLTFRRRSPQVRYALALTAFLVLAVLPAGLFAWRMADDEGTTSRASTDLVPKLRLGTRLTEAPLRSAAANALTRGTRSGASQERVPKQELGNEKLKAGSPPLPVWAAENLQKAAGQCYAVALTILPGIWFVGFPLACAWILLGVAGTEQLRRRCRPIVNDEWLALCRGLTEQLGIRVHVRFAVCDRVAVPLLIGIVRPLVLLPASALSGYSPEQVEMVVLHELAHMRRWDNLVNLLQRMVEAVLFFHPAVWWLSRRVRLEREHCCDAVVLAHTHAPQRYAEFLAHLAHPAVFRQAAFGVSANEQLVARIRHILNQENETMKVSRSSLAVALSAFFIALIAVATTWAHLKASAAPIAIEAVHRNPPLPSAIEVSRPLQEPRVADARQLGTSVAQASSTPAQGTRTNARPPASAGMSIGPASPSGGAKTIAEPAVVRAFDTASLYARINGTVAKVDVDVGDRVKAGKLLIEIDAPEAQADVDVNQAKVAEAKGQLQQAQLAVEPIDVRLAEVQKLIRKNEISPAEVSLAKARRDIAQAAITTAKARLEIAAMELRKAQAVLQSTLLRAPFDGIVTKRNVSVGDVLFAGSGAASRPLVVIERIDRVRVILSVPEQYVLQVEPGCPATVNLDALAGKQFHAKVSRIGNFLETTNRGMRVEIDLLNPNGQLMSGMIGRGTITLKTPPHGD